VGQREKLAGLIATNTTIIPELGAGGVSGKLLNAKALQMRTRLLEISQGTGLEIIGVGGVSSFQDVWDFWRRGGRLMQVYTGLIYQGPQLLLDIATGVERALEKTQCASLAQMLSDWRELPETI
jgi:dihydroorotate dehydrogenase